MDREVLDAMSKNYTFTLDLYGIYDRAYEDCKAHVVCEVPDNYEEIAPKYAEVKLVNIQLEEDTERWLTGTYFTDVDKLIADIRKQFEEKDWFYNTVIEYMMEDLFPWYEDDLDTAATRWEQGVDRTPNWSPVGGTEVKLTSMEDLLS